MHSPTRASMFAALGLTLAAAACGGGPAATTGSGATAGPGTAGPGTTAPVVATPGTGGGGGKSACDLLPDADIKEIAGLTVATKDPDPVDAIYENVCRWTFEGPGEMDLGVLNVDAKGFFERTAELEGSTEVSGLGDRAVRTTVTGSMLVLSGDTMLDLFTIGTGTSDEVEEALVERALSKLGS